MSERENLISSIRYQKEVLDSLLVEFENKPDLSFQDYQRCEVTTKNVEKSLKRLRLSALDELMRSIQFDPEILD